MSLSNCPIGTAFFMIVEYGTYNGYIIQSIYPVTDNNVPVYRRIRQGTAWGAWQKSPTRSEFDTLNNSISSTYKKGTFTTQTFYGVTGFLTEGQAQLRVSVPINLVSEVSSVSTNNNAIALRTASGGYVKGSWASIEPPTTVSVFKKCNIVEFIYTDASGWKDSSGNTIPNNSTVVSYVKCDITLS